MTELENAARAATERKTTIEFDHWLQLGMDNGFIGPPVCATHDGTPSSEEEDVSFDEGEDICLHVLRLYTDSGHKEAVEANHSPSVWRRTNMGW